MGKKPHITIVGSRPTQQPRTKRMTKYILAAEDTNNSDKTVLLMGHAGMGAYQQMTHRFYTGRLTLDRVTGEADDLATAMFECTEYSTWANGLVNTRLFSAFDEVRDAALINTALATAPVSNSHTSEVHSIAGTPEFRASLLDRTIWGVRRIVDPNLGMWEVGSAGCEMDIPTYRGKSVFVSAVALGRAFGLSKMELDHGPMAKFNHRIGCSRGARKAWERIGSDFEIAKVAAWNDYHNAGAGRLNKIEITAESVATLAHVIRRKIENTVIRSLDLHITPERNEVFI